MSEHRRSPIDIMDDVLRPLLGSIKGTSAALSCWHALRRGGWLQDEPSVPLDEEDGDKCWNFEGRNCPKDSACHYPLQCILAR